MSSQHDLEKKFGPNLSTVTKAQLLDFLETNRELLIPELIRVLAKQAYVDLKLDNQLAVEHGFIQNIEATVDMHHRQQADITASAQEHVTTFGGEHPSLARLAGTFGVFPPASPEEKALEEKTSSTPQMGMASSGGG